MLSVHPCCCVPSTICQICATVTDCPGSPIAGATVTVTQGATTIGTCTTDALGKCCVDVSATGPGTYTVAVTKPTNSGSNRTVTVSSCPGTTNVALYSNTLLNGWNPTVTGCFGTGPLAGATISIQGGTYITNSSGQPTTGPIPLTNGAYSLTITKPPRFTTYTESGTIAGCAVAIGNKNLSIAAGYVCQAGGTNCAGTGDPIPTTLQVSGPVGNVAAVFGGTTWVGCSTFVSGNVFKCGGGTVTGNVPWSAEISAAGQLTIRYSGGGASYNGGTWSTCPTTFTWSCGGLLGSTSVGSTNCSGGSPVPAFSQTYTVAGLVGLAAVFNGTWTVTE